MLKFLAPSPKPQAGTKLQAPTVLVRTEPGAWSFLEAWSLGLGVLLLSTPSSAVNFPLRWRWSNPSPHGANIVDMAYSPSLGLAVQVAERGQIFTSADLDLWLPRDSNITNALQGVTFFGSRILVVGENGAVLYADDVSNFQLGALADGPTTDWLVAVAASPALAVAVGDNGAVYTTTNGINWKRQNSGTNTALNGVAAGAGTFVVVGDYATILTSPNGTNEFRPT